MKGMEPLGGGALLKEVGHSGMGHEVYNSLTSLLVLSLLPAPPRYKFFPVRYLDIATRNTSNTGLGINLASDTHLAFWLSGIHVSNQTLGHDLSCLGLATISRFPVLCGNGLFFLLSPSQPLQVPKAFRKSLKLDLLPQE